MGAVAANIPSLAEETELLEWLAEHDTDTVALGVAGYMYCARLRRVVAHRLIRSSRQRAITPYRTIVVP
eukprot:3857376-Prymnesium_polylepis.1